MPVTEPNSAPSLYRRVGTVVHPTKLTMGPWRPDAQHGGPPSALLTALCESHVGQRETLARVHVNLLTSVPLAPLETVARRIPVSRRVAHVSAELRHDDRVVAEARALVLTGGETPDPDWVAGELAARSWREAYPSVPPHWGADSSATPFHRDGIEHRFVAGTFDQAGPAVDWVRLRQPLLAGEVTSGFQRIMAVVDVGSGISAVFDPAKGFGLINADLDVAFVAQPVGEWLRLEAESHVDRCSGTGTAITKVYDQHRLVAIATQCLLGTGFDANRGSS